MYDLPAQTMDFGLMLSHHRQLVGKTESQTALQAY